MQSTPEEDRKRSEILRITVLGTALFVRYYSVYFGWLITSHDVSHPQALGFFIWNIDNLLCFGLTDAKAAVGLPTAFLLEYVVALTFAQYLSASPDSSVPSRGHAWWHILTGTGSRFMTWRFWKADPLIDTPHRFPHCCRVSGSSSDTEATVF